MPERQKTRGLRAGRAAHLLAAYRRLQEACCNPAGSRQSGFDLYDLCTAGTVRWIFVPVPRDAQDGGALVIGATDDLPGRALPRSVSSPLGNEQVPLRVLRSPLCVADSGSGVYPVRNLSRDIEAGSVGAFARDTDSHSHYFALTAAHVVAGAASATIRDTVEILGQRTVRGQLHDWYPVMGSPEYGTSIDAAAVALDAGDAWELMRDSAILPTALADLQTRDTLLTLRRTSGALGGRFQGYWSGWVDARVTMDGRDYWLNDGLAYDLEPPYSQGGDSGAGVWDSQEQLVAFHCGHTPDNESGWNGVGCAARNVLDHFQLELLTRSTSVMSRPMASPGQSLQGMTARSPRAADPSVAPSTGITSQNREVDILARTLWGEARGEKSPERSMSAVAAVVLNRVGRKTYWGKSITEVCQKPWQFSCWNRNDPNLPQLQRVTATNRTFALALTIASQAATKQLADETRGATHYYSRSLRRAPGWAVGKTPCCTIDRHLFFNDIA